MKSQTIQSKQVREFCKKAKKVKTQKNSIPIISDFYAVKNGDFLTSNFERSIIYHSGVQTDSFLIGKKLLEKIVQKTNEISFEVIENKVYINKDKGIFSFEINENVKDYPYIYIDNLDEFTWLSYQDVKEIKTSTNYIINDNTRPVMNNVCIDSHIVATDGHRLRFVYRNSQESERFLLHSEIVKALDNNTDYTVYSDSTRENIYLSDGLFIYHCKEPGKYPNWRAVIPEDQPVKAQLNAKELLDVIETGLIASNQNVFRFIFNFDAKENKVHISTADNDFNISYDKELKCQINESMRIALNGTFLGSILKTEKLENLSIKMTDSNKAAIINDYVLLMPVKIDD